MNTRRILMILVTIILIGAVVAGIVSAFEPVQSLSASVKNLENVREYAPASILNGVNYAIDGGQLYAGGAAGWRRLPTPRGVIANAVALHPQRDGVVYLGAANEAAIYVSSDHGQSWSKIPLAAQAVVAVTAIAVDGTNQLVHDGANNTRVSPDMCQW